MSYFNSSATAVCGSFAAICVLAMAQPAAATDQPPYITGRPSTVATVGFLYKYQVQATDADSKVLTFSIQNKPAWASFNTTTGLLTGTPKATDVGSSVIEVDVSDGYTGATLAFPLTVITQAQATKPIYIVGRPQTAATVGSTYSFQLPVSGGDGNPLVFSIQNKPSWATFNTQTGVLAGIPRAGDVGVDPGITISVSDGYNSAVMAFDLAVSQIGGGSVTLSWAPPPVNTDGSVLTNLAGYDLYYGTTANNLDHTITVNNPGVTRYVIGNLTATTWYFSMAAYNSLGLRGTPTGVVGFTP
jgi:hypothetical protein